MNIVFTTGYSEYTQEAISLRVSGYILKPVTLDKVQAELSELRHPVELIPKRRLQIKTFGNFEVFVDQVPLKFQYTKTKELLAYLVDRNGSLCSNSQIMNVLWEDESSNNHHISYLKNIRADLLSTLRRLRCDDVIIRQWGKLGVVPEKIDCDYFDWLEDKPYAVQAYMGEYMVQYSWSELTNAELSRTKEVTV